MKTLTDEQMKKIKNALTQAWSCIDADRERIREASGQPLDAEDDFQIQEAQDEIDEALKIFN